MTHIPQPGQKLRITNPDYIIFSEEWTVLTVEQPVITFSCKKWWDYNSITMQGHLCPAYFFLTFVLLFAFPSSFRVPDSSR